MRIIAKKTTTEELAFYAGFGRAILTRLGLAPLPPIGRNSFNGDGALGTKD
jgi:hypothetical protein